VTLFDQTFCCQFPFGRGQLILSGRFSSIRDVILTKPRQAVVCLGFFFALFKTFSPEASLTRKFPCERIPASQHIMRSMRAKGCRNNKKVLIKKSAAEGSELDRQLESE
jgi:hypothetical protein